MNELLASTPWLAATLAACAAVLAAMLVRGVASALLRRATQHLTVARAVVQASHHPAGAVFPLMALQVIWTAAPDTLGHIATVRHWNGVLLIAALTWLAMAAISGFATGIIARYPVTVEDNLQARRIQTQARVLSRCAMVVVLIAGTAMALMTFPGARQVGASLLASAGVLGIIGGLAARPVFSNLIAGLQLALAQPIRIDDVLIVNGEWGRVEEITGTYVVLKIWDERRLIIPLQWFIENPFENWTRNSAQILGTVFLYVDFATPLPPLRDELQRIVASDPRWDGRVCTLVAIDSTERALQLRCLVSAASSGNAFDLRCRVREDMLAYLAREFPQCLPQIRIPQPATGVPTTPTAPISPSTPQAPAAASVTFPSTA